MNINYFWKQRKTLTIKKRYFVSIKFRMYLMLWCCSLNLQKKSSIIIYSKHQLQSQTRYQQYLCFFLYSKNDILKNFFKFFIFFLCQTNRPMQIDKVWLSHPKPYRLQKLNIYLGYVTCLVENTMGNLIIHSHHRT